MIDDTVGGYSNFSVHAFDVRLRLQVTCSVHTHGLFTSHAVGPIGEPFFSTTTFLISLTRSEDAVQFETIPDGVKKDERCLSLTLHNAEHDNKQNSNNPRRLMPVSSGSLPATRVPNQVPNTGIGGLPS